MFALVRPLLRLKQSFRQLTRRRLLADSGDGVTTAHAPNRAFSYARGPSAGRLLRRKVSCKDLPERSVPTPRRGQMAAEATRWPRWLSRLLRPHLRGR